MKKDQLQNQPREITGETTQDHTGVLKEIKNGAFNFLQSLPRQSPPPDPNLLRDRDPSSEIESDVAGGYVGEFRNGIDDISIPLCWSFDKEALIKLLGITSYSHYTEVNGVRFYAGVNGSGQLTLIAVSTTAGTRENCNDCRNDLTEDDEYPYFDYADPCPSNCSETGNLKADSEGEVFRVFSRHD